MLVLGIDPGTALTGYALVRQEDGEPELVVAGVIRTASDEALAVRLQAIYAGVTQLAAEYLPEAAAVEEVFFSRNARTALSVGHARGVTLLALADAGLPIYEYKPLQVKQAIAGYGGADKQQVQQMVTMLLNLESVPQPDDAADAVAVAVCHIHSATMSALLDSAQR